MRWYRCLICIIIYYLIVSKHRLTSKALIYYELHAHNALIFLFLLFSNALIFRFLYKSNALIFLQYNPYRYS